jgi:hypothetical protein
MRLESLGHHALIDALIQRRPGMLATKRVSPDGGKTQSKVVSKVLEVPDLHITILSFNAATPPVSAKSISNARWHRKPPEDACGLFLSAMGRGKAISLCSYIEDEYTQVIETSSVEINAGPACQLLKTDEFPGRLCANLAFSVTCVLQEFLKQGFDLLWPEMVVFKLYFPSGFEIDFSSGYVTSGHRAHRLKFCLTTGANESRTMTFSGKYEEASPTEEAVKRKHMRQGVPDEYPQTYRQAKVAGSNLSVSNLLDIFQRNCASGYTLTTNRFSIAKKPQGTHGNHTRYNLTDPIQLCLKALKKSRSEPVVAVAKSWHEAVTGTMTS